MIYFKKILFLSALLILNCFSIAQQILNINGSANFRVVHWGTAEGLSAEEGNTMLKDVNGFLWIGSPHGLNRFDGDRFKHYFATKSKQGAICDNTIYNLIEDSLHNIWIGTKNGMSRYDIKADTFKNFQPQKNNAYTFIIPFWATKNAVYCIEGGYTLAVYDVHSFSKKILMKLSPAYPGGNISHSIFDAKSNSVWMLGGSAEPNNSGLFNFSLTDGKSHHYSLPLFKNIPEYALNSSDMCYDLKRNAIWISCFDGLVEFTLDDKKFHHAEGLNEIKNPKGFSYAEGLTIDSHDNIWWCTWPTGVIIYNPSAASFVPAFSDAHEQMEIAHSNQFLYCDPEGIVWTSCNQQSRGIYQIIPSSIPVVHYRADTSKPHSLSGNVLEAIINANNGKLWIGQGDELNIFDPKTGFFDLISSEKDLPVFHGRLIYPVQIDTVHQKALFDIWSQKTAISELYEMDISSRHCYHVIFKDSSNKKILQPPTSYNVIAYKNGGVLFSNAGVFAINIDSGLAHWISPSFANSANIFATDNDHLIFIKGNNVDENFTYTYLNNKWIRIESPLDSLEWTSIYYDAKNKTYWAGSDDELICYNKDFKSVHQYTTKDGLLNDAITGILCDDKGNIWLQHNRAILQLSISTGKITRLSEIDGLVNQSYAYNKPVATEGDLYFWGNQGIDRISPGKLTEHYPASYVYVESLQINQKYLSDESINNLQKLSLHYSENNIVIETGNIDYYSKGSSRIRFKLEGGDIKNASWQYEPDYYTIRYEQLPPGDYKLIMQASNTADEFDGPQKTLFINISPAFWNTWWFRLVIIAIAAYVIVSIVKWRIQKIKHDAAIQNQLKELEMKALKAQMNPHFIYNALNSIQALVANDKKEEGIHYIGSFSRLLRQVLENSENNIISLDKELETIGLYIQMEALRLDMRLQYKKIVPKEVVTEFEKMPPLILQPFVENALWHGLSNKQGEKEIEISISVQDGWLLCDITDNGIGRTKAQQLKNNTATIHQSKGIDITYKRLVDFNEDASVTPIEFFDLYDDKKISSGTRVMVRIKRKSSLSSLI